MIQFYAQPYDISTTGFYFDSPQDYRAKAATAENAYGQPVEEFEIQFIDGEAIDYAFADAFGVNQANLCSFFELVEKLDDHEKQRFIVAVGECGYTYDPATDDLMNGDVDLYEVENLRELAEQFVDEGLLGDIPSHLECYIDYDAIARDLTCDYSMIDIAGDRFAYRCG